MIDFDITHHIQKYILSVLNGQRIARFRDLREPGVDTNLFAYHLKLLVKNGFVSKIDGGYTLDDDGFRYVERVSKTNMKIRIQPKIITMLVIENRCGQVLLQKRTKQPFIDTWTLPNGKLHINDKSVKDAAIREASEKVNLHNINPNHIGDCYIRVKSDGEIVTSTLVHIFKCKVNKSVSGQQWVHPDELCKYTLAPAVDKIVKKTLHSDTFFFDEFSEKLSKFE